MPSLTSIKLRTLPHKSFGPCCKFIFSSSARSTLSRAVAVVGSAKDEGQRKKISRTMKPVVAKLAVGASQVLFWISAAKTQGFSMVLPDRLSRRSRKTSNQIEGSQIYMAIGSSERARKRIPVVDDPRYGCQ